MSIKCTNCNDVIDQDRIKIWLELTGKSPKFCVNCSPEKKNVGFMNYSHKTAGEAVIINMNQSNSRENFRRAKRIYHRSR